MPSPFPGMDPYLEHPEFWPGLQTWLLTTIAGDLGARLRPRQYVTIEDRAPELDEVRQRYIEIRAVGTKEVITLIEVLSPAIKQPGEARQSYETKRLETAKSATNLVEIDILRAGEPLPTYYRGRSISGLGDYRVLISRAANRPRADLYTLSVRDPLPVVPIPLRSGEEEQHMDLQSLLNRVFDLGSYDLAIDYRADPVPPLRPEDAAWAEALLREKGLR